MPGQGASATRYAYKASLFGSAHQFELTGSGLSWKAGGRSAIWPYADIACIRLSYRPVWMQSHRFRADIEHGNGQSLTVFSTSWQTAALMAPHDREYRAFITELHERLAVAASRAVLVGGIGPKTYAAGVALLVMVTIAISGLLIRAIATGEFAGALFLIGFAVLLGWQIGGFLRRNRPRSYTWADLPEALLP